MEIILELIFIDFQVMKANDKGDPSYQLGEALGPELRVLNVRYTGIGQCEEKPEKPATENFSPIPRNQVDHINATAGELLVFKVPDVSRLLVGNFGKDFINNP